MSFLCIILYLFILYPVTYFSFISAYLLVLTFPPLFLSSFLRFWFWIVPHGSQVELKEEMKMCILIWASLYYWKHFPTIVDQWLDFFIFWNVQKLHTGFGKRPHSKVFLSDPFTQSFYNLVNKMYRHKNFEIC